MARRNGRPGNYLMTSDYSGVTCYASELVFDYWGNKGKPNEILKRNLQEIATPLSDPYPVPYYIGPQYEQTTACQFEIAPLFIGNTNIPFPNNTNASQVLNLNPAIPDMQIGCTFRVGIG